MKFARVMLWIAAIVLLSFSVTAVILTVNINAAPVELTSVSHDQIKNSHMYSVSEMTLTECYTEDEGAICVAAYTEDASKKPMIVSVMLKRTSSLYEQYAAAPQGEPLTVSGYFLKDRQLFEDEIEKGYSAKADSIYKALKESKQEAIVTFHHFQYVCELQGDPTAYARTQSTAYLIIGGVLLLASAACVVIALYLGKKDKELIHSPLLNRKNKSPLSRGR